MGHVLIVDDDPMILRAMERALRREHIIYKASSVDEVKRVLVEHFDNRRDPLRPDDAGWDGARSLRVAQGGSFSAG